jgi:hypothetical protein
MVEVEEEEEEEDDEEETAEDESITRCVCGESRKLFSNGLIYSSTKNSYIDSLGLMVCCDECEVWQHCECMGLEKDEIPDEYFCELCKPSDHIEIKSYEKYVNEQIRKFNILILI